MKIENDKKIKRVHKPLKVKVTYNGNLGRGGFKGKTKLTFLLVSEYILSYSDLFTMTDLDSEMDSLKSQLKMNFLSFVLNHNRHVSLENMYMSVFYTHKHTYIYNIKML